MQSLNVANVRKILESRAKNGIFKFTTMDIINEAGVPISKAALKKASSTICHLARKYEVYRLNETQRYEGNERACRLYTTKIKEVAEQDPSYRPPQQEVKEPELSFEDIGRAIVSRIRQLEAKNKDLATKIGGLAEKLEQKRNTICELNGKLTRLNEMLEKDKNNSSGKFKLSEIARINGHV
jgi:SMC interacting uncharacterized protein involved in chromosome segregation